MASASVPTSFPACRSRTLHTGGGVPVRFKPPPAAIPASSTLIRPRSPPPGEFGNAPNLISSLRLPAFLNEDLSLSKRTKITEKVDLQLQGNFFNVLNRTIFSGGGAATFIYNLAPPNLSSAALKDSNTPFAILTNQQNGPRLIQIGARLEF